MRTMAGSVDHKFLADAFATLRRMFACYAVRWIADERIMELRDDVAKLLEGPQPSRSIIWPSWVRSIGWTMSRACAVRGSPTSC